MSVGSHISLFSGIGMTDLAAEKMGFKTIATAEIDPFCRSVLQTRFPDALHFDDVSKVTTDIDSRPGPLLISGGFPCQDIASAGTGLGLQGYRSGQWSEFARIISELQPDHVLIENSPLLRSRGLVHVLRDLWIAGYDAVWDGISAAHVGAPHYRDRIWIYARPVAHPGRMICSAQGNVLDRSGAVRNGILIKRETQFPTKGMRSSTRWPTPTRSDGSGGPGTTPKRTGGKNLRTAVAEAAGNGRLNPEWVEWLMGVPAGWSDPSVPNRDLLPHVGWDYSVLTPMTAAKGYPQRSARIKALGNGLVPECAVAALRTMKEES